MMALLGKKEQFGHVPSFVEAMREANVNLAQVDASIYAASQFRSYNELKKK